MPPVSQHAAPIVQLTQSSTSKEAVLREQVADLHALAQLVAHEQDHAELGARETRLGVMVTEYLAHGGDAVLEGAMEKAELALDADTAGELGHQIEYASEWQELGALSNGQACEARLIAIPVILPDVRLLDHGRLPENAATAELVESLRVHGLVAPSQGLTLVKYLYHPDELDALPPSSVFKFCQQLALAERNDVNPGAGWTPTAPGSAISIEPVAGLRYLVGTVAGPVTADSLLDPADQIVESAKMDAWRSHAAKLVQDAFTQAHGDLWKGRPVQVHAISSFFAARRTGEVLYKGLDTLSALLGVLQSTGIAAAKVSSVVAPYIMEDETVSVVASLSSQFDGSVLGSTEYPVSAFELLDDALNEVHAILIAQGIGQVAVSDALTKLERCECCGDPEYLVPRFPSLDSPNVVPPGTVLH